MTIADVEKLKEMTFQVMNEGLGNVMTNSKEQDLMVEKVMIDQNYILYKPSK